MTPLPHGMRVTFSSALIDEGTVASQIGSRLWEQQPRVESLASAMLDSNHVASVALTDVSNLYAVSTDYFHAFARLLRMEETFGPSLAALVRGFIEASGRLWWLLSSESPEELAYRAAMMQLGEARMAAKRGVRSARVFANGGHEEISAEKAVEEAEALLARVRVPGGEETVPGYTALATAVLEAAGVADPVMEYSHLSGAAHGEAGTNVGFSGRRRDASDGDVAAYTLGLPIRNANMYFWDVDHVLDLLLQRMIDLWGIEAERERWSASRARVHTTLDTLFQLLKELPEVEELRAGR